MGTLGIQGSQFVLEFIVSNNAPVLGITCNNPPAGVVGTPYSHAFPATAGTPPYTFAILPSSAALPPGLSLNTATGVVSGTPTVAGTFNFTVQVTDSIPNTATVNCSITIAAALGSIRITLRGVKLRPVCESDEPKMADVMPQVSKVDRAL
jgi:hypothetical protein